MSQEALDEYLGIVGDIKTLILDLQAKADAGTLTAAEEQTLKSAMLLVAQTADPNQPNP